MNVETAFVSAARDATAIRLVSADEYSEWRETLNADERKWLERQKFHGEPGDLAWLPEGDTVTVGWSGNPDLASLGHLPLTLPEGDYQLETPVNEVQLVGWGLGSYQFTRYKAAERESARLVWPQGASVENVVNQCNAVNLTRDLINTGAADMAPAHLAAEALALADTFNAESTVWEGDELLDHGCGAIHAVGRAAADAPRLVDIRWGEANHPAITIIGKGVTFDSGGLDIKSANGMRQMKKDMGGAAAAIGLAQLVMAQALPVRLRLLIPTAENAIAGNAYRPGDVLSTHKGKTVEIDNTDAEGRLLLCDALSLACEGKPDLIVDYATLTGAARFAVGTELAAMFSTSDPVADALLELGTVMDDPVWRLPLHAGYDYMLKSSVADVVNSASSGYAGAITAALFLKRFVDEGIDWVHFDIMAFNTRSRPARPEGGEAMALRTVYGYLAERYGTP